MKKIICLLLVVVFAMGCLVACGEAPSTEPSNSDSQGQTTQESQGQADSGEKKLVGLVMLTQSNPYFVALAQTVEAKAAEYG